MRTNTNIYALMVSLISMLPVVLQASHIVGGEITYECLGYIDQANANHYRFTMKVYRNCNRLAMDVFSDPAPITIYRGDREPYDSIMHFNVGLQKPVINIPPDVSNPCLILPPDICVEEGTYYFEAFLPVGDETYHIAYQRCCRNATISNIMMPDRTGATFSVQISPAAQRVCNDSPTFNNFPPIVICVNEPINFDHSATDNEGDQITYEFCSALKGGGTLGAFQPGDPTSCEGFMPDPACPPPYKSVDYRSPTYSPNNPMGGNPQINVNPATGLIGGTPRLLGQYVVGVCVKEYRNGELLSVIQRDFQFNVANCQPTVDARMDAEQSNTDQYFVINSCGDSSVDIINQSIQRSFIKTQRWDFDVRGQAVRSTDWDFSYTFPDTGSYYGTLILNENSDCGDTALVRININPSLSADFEYDYDTCLAGPVRFRDLSVSEGGKVNFWAWDFGGGESSGDTNPEHIYRTPGPKQVTLRVRDINDCLAESTQNLTYYPVPALVVVEPSTFEDCQPVEVVFNNLSTPIDESYRIDWDLGNGQTISGVSPSYIYTEPGVYDIGVEIVSPIGCRTSASWTNWITVLPTPLAAFSYSPGELSNLNSEVTFTDESLDASSWLWDFSGYDFSRRQSPVFVFPDTGLQVVQLIVTHESGCQDTTEQVLDVVPEIRYFMPNAFTPNGDAKNDVFRGKGLFEGMEDFDFSIWNRWGEQLFQTSDPDEAWNGRKDNSGQLLPPGVYVYLVTFSGPRGQHYEYKGFATLVR